MDKGQSVKALIIISSILISCSNTSSNTVRTDQLAVATTTPTHFECTDPFGCIDIAPGEPIHLAWIQSISGVTAPIGKTNVNSAEIALNEVGFQWLGHPIQWDGQDGLCSVEGGRLAATVLVADPTVVAVLGTSCSEEARGALPILSEAGLTLVSSTNLSADLTDPDSTNHYPGFLRTVPNNLMQARFAAVFVVKKLGFSDAAIIQDSSSFTQSLQSEFLSELNALGGIIKAQEAIGIEDTLIDTALGKIAAAAPQILYVAALEPEASSIVQQKCKEAGLENTQLLGTDVLLTESFVPVAGGCALGMYLTGTYVDPTNLSEFLNTFSSQFGEAPATSYGPFAYDAMKLILSGIERAALADSDGTLHIPRQALRDALYATSGIHGLTGEITCDVNGDCAAAGSIAIFQVTQQNLDGLTSLSGNQPIWVASDN